MCIRDRGDTLRVLVIIPCYNEEANIERVVARLTRVTADLPYVVDYVIVNDCSTDRSADVYKRQLSPVS